LPMRLHRLARRGSGASSAQWNLGSQGLRTL